MEDRISLENIKYITGLANIVLSQVDDTVYINSSIKVDPSNKGSLAIYSKDDSSTLIGSGKNCVWNKDDSVLEVINIATRSIKGEIIESQLVKSKCFEAEAVETDTLISKYNKTGFLTADAFESNSVVTNSVKVDYNETNKHRVNKWFGFASQIKETVDAFKISVNINPQNQKEVLAIKNYDVDDNNNSSLILALEDGRIYCQGTINMPAKIVSSSIGSPGDLKGDVSIDDNYVYVCTENFDGKSKIWKRTKLESW